MIGIAVNVAIMIDVVVNVRILKDVHSRPGTEPQITAPRSKGSNHYPAALVALLGGFSTES